MKAPLCAAFSLQFGLMSAAAAENRPKLFTLLLLIVPGMLWGLSFTTTEVALRSYPPFTNSALRPLISLLPLGLLLLWRGAELPRSLDEWQPFIILGMINNALPFYLSSWGQLFIDGGLASILISLMPLFTVTLAVLVTREESLNRYKLIGVLLGLLGVIILVGPQLLSNVGGSLKGQLAIMGAALCYAVSGLYSRRVLRSTGETDAITNIFRVTALQYLPSTLLLIPLAFLFETPLQIRPEWGATLALFGQAWFISPVAVAIYYFVLQRTEASLAAMATYMIPISGVLSGALFLNERVTVQLVVALVVIVSGLVISNQGFSKA